MPLPLPDYDQLDATDLAGFVRRGEVTPLELVEAAIARIEVRDLPLNAVVHRWFDRAREEARGPLPDGPFRGVPFLLKDLLAAAEGLPLTFGSRVLAGWRPRQDAEIVRRFRAAGLVTLGRTNAPELGLLGVTEPELHGPCRNPWDPTRTPGGSSGGSAAAVAARMVPMAHGGDGGGSIRIPAGHCALFGLKPSRGRVSLGPEHGESWGGLVQEHVLTRSVRDSAAMLDLLAGALPGDPNGPPPPARPWREEVAAAPGRLRVAFTPRALLGRETHPDCLAALESAARLLADLGHDVQEAHPPIDRDVLARAYLVVVAADVARDVEELARLAGVPARRARFELPTRFLAALGRALSADALVAAHRDLHAARRAMAGFMARWDLLLTPTAARPAVRVGELSLKAWERAAIRLQAALPLRAVLERALIPLARASFHATPNTQLFNLTGQPAMSVPLYWNGAGLPIGVQVAATVGGESLLFRVGAQLEAARPWANRLPPGLSAVSSSSRPRGNDGKIAAER